MPVPADFAAANPTKATTMLLQSAQLSATEAALERVLPFTQPADAVLSHFFRERRKLGAQDRQFVAETVFGVLRHLLALRQMLGDDDRPRILLLAYLNRYCGLSLRELEKLCRPQEAEQLKQMQRDSDNWPLAVKIELPQWVVDRLSAYYDEATIRRLGQSLQQPAPLDVRVNTLLATRDEVLAALPGSGLKGAPTRYSPFGIRLEGKPALNKHPMFNAGKIEVQDEGSQLLGLLLAPKRGEMVVDFCAGAGGKTLLLGAMMQSTGRLYAFDVSERRLANLKPRLKRSGLSNVQPQLIGSENDPRIKRLAGKVDRVLVDAPCSGLGTLRRNPDLKFRQSSQSVDELTGKQAAILASAARLVKRGGRLVYATCSILQEENQQIVAAFLAAHPDFRLLPAGDLLAQQGVALQMGDYLQLDPAQHGTDGFFAAALTRD